MKKTFLFLMVLSVSFSSLVAQNTPTTESKSTRQSQTDLLNELYIGYGGLSIFYFTGRMAHTNEYPTEVYYPGAKYTEPASPGNFYLGYNRSLNKVVGVGFMFGYQNFKYTETTIDPTVRTIDATDILLTGIARVTFSYLNKPSIRMYSGVGIGLTIDFGKTSGDVEDSERKLWPGGQLTLMGLRFGRTFGGFVEFGFGSYGIVNAGLSYKFAD